MGISLASLFVGLLIAGVRRPSKPKAEGQPEAQAELIPGQASELGEPAKEVPTGEQSARPVVLIKDSRAEAGPRLEAVRGVTSTVKRLAAIVDTEQLRGCCSERKRI